MSTVSSWRSVRSSTTSSSTRIPRCLLASSIQYNAIYLLWITIFQTFLSDSNHFRRCTFWARGTVLDFKYCSTRSVGTISLSNFNRSARKSRTAIERSAFPVLIPFATWYSFTHTLFKLLTWNWRIVSDFDVHSTLYITILLQNRSRRSWPTRNVWSSAAVFLKVSLRRSRMTTFLSSPLSVTSTFQIFWLFFVNHF